ncbi:ABC transporter ATP-binding protein [Leifsonia virtsii]|uniref:ATP-binding cassette domain-containing protein n=1 Tax=Leifsonia virtsii TaxID=3035915 RepID=A0ABT8IYG0_9MICO|nr:ATP-binding cassette domain-containing protein [Leifsonia virtsii]MDN4597858.1 ATP-binding cassette domain-containing protein [Leifsonia virtsii]
MCIGERTIIDDLSFVVEAGETFGFLGSNGSGKTTTLRALLGMCRATGGRLLIDGEPFEPGSGAPVGYLPEERGLYRKDAVLDIMIYFAQIKGIGRRQARRWAEEYLDRVGLADKGRLKLERLSGGQQQKIQLGIAMLGEPRLLILDEPAKGLDPLNRQLLMNLVAERQQDGATVILVTHNMDEVERLCDRALLLRDGRAAAYGPIADIQDQFGARTLLVRAHAPIPESPLYAIGQSVDGEQVIHPAGAASDEEILKHLVTADVRPTGFRSCPVSMDEVFVRVYGEKVPA